MGVDRIPKVEGNDLSHIGDCYEKMDMPDSAKWYYETAFGLVQDDESRPRKEARLLQLLGEWHLENGDVRKAIEMCKHSLGFAERANNFDHIIQNCMCLSKAYERTGDHALALTHFQRAIALKDSVAIEDQGRDIAFLEASSSYEKRVITDSLKRVEETNNAELQHAAVVSRERNRRNVSSFPLWVYCSSQGVFTNGFA